MQGHGANVGMFKTYLVPLTEFGGKGEPYEIPY
jgi:hypothetical protein